MKNIYIVLTKDITLVSKLISHIGQVEYSHASISLSKELDCMYSFGRLYKHIPLPAGFIIERFDKGVLGEKKEITGLIIEVQITEEQYNKVENMLNDFVSNKEKYTYNTIGMLGNMFNKEFVSEDSFYCSEFVYYVLKKCGIIELDIPDGLVRPNNLLDIKGNIIYKGNLKQYV